MHVAILGFGKQGQSALEYWSKTTESITVCDQDQQLEIPANTNPQLGPDYLKNLARFDLVVRSPSVHPRDIVAANTPDVLEKVTTVTNEFMRVCPSQNIIGVTGTKGKGTTSSLIAKILETAGKRVHLGGNIGTPPLEMLKENINTEDWVVLELANFQLIDLKYSPPIAVCVMVDAEHLDWHTNEAEYIEAKQQLFRWQTNQNIAVYFGQNSTSEHIASISPGTKIPYMKHPGADVINDEVIIDGHKICHVNEIKLLGKHNWQNVCAAVTAVWQITQDVDAIKGAIQSFSGLPYRIETRGEVNGVTFINDSFAAQPEATIAAIEAVVKPKVLILGGYDRNLDLTNLASVITEHESDIRKVLLIGASAHRVKATLDTKNFNNYSLIESRDMAEIVKSARSYAESGDAVLLSPGFPSFDMFKNFEDRGQQFNQAVEML